MDGMKTKINKIKNPIFISAASARSGTSLITGCLSTSGIWIGNCAPSSPYNKKGSFENLNIQKRIIKYHILTLQNIKDILDTTDINIICNYLNSINYYDNIKIIIKKILYKQGYINNIPWMFKWPIILELHSLFKYIYPNATYVFVERDINNIIESNNKAFKRPKKNTLEEYNKNIEYLLTQNIPNLYKIRSNDIINGNTDSLKDLFNKLNLNYDKNKIENFIDKSLWHHNE
jgi:hypothetical protein